VWRTQPRKPLAKARYWCITRRAAVPSDDGCATRLDDIPAEADQENGRSEWSHVFHPQNKKG